MPTSDALLDVLNACDYEPIDHYAIIGDCRTAALVSRTGSLDWLCLPDFSSPAMFAALLDRRRGGRFLVRPRDAARVERRYAGRSAVLETTFHCASGVARLTDFVPMPPAAENAPFCLLRKVQCLQGRITVDVAWQPRPDYARAVPQIERAGALAWSFRHEDVVTVLDADAALAASDGAVGGTLELAAGAQHRFVMTYAAADVRAATDRCDTLQDVEDGTVAWWEAWCSRNSYGGAYPDAVMRACLALKLLTSQFTGAVMAAATTSLPESFDAPRNWDYRYCWLRDTSLLLQSFVDLGFEQESAAFLAWLLGVGRKPRLQPLYDLHGHAVPDEIVLDHLEGYRGRGPVRVGNTASGQLQLDIYGELAQTAYRFVARGGELNTDERRLLVGLGDAVCELWRQPDQSIWETRNPPRHYTYSKLMCWVALDRLMALNRHVPLEVDAAKLQRERDSIRREIDAHGFNASLGSYVGYFGGSDPDASLLLMLRYGYLTPGDPRMRRTYEFIFDRLSADGLLYRYPPGERYDGVPGGENLFVVCCFWAVDYLARSGEVDKAVKLFERLLGVANDVGLYSEQFDTRTRAALGNFPQAYSHSGLVTAAMAIEQALKGRRGKQIRT